MATCYRHPSRETGVSCSACGKAICPDCMTPTSVGMRCPECAKQRTQVRTIQSLEGQPTATYVLIAINVIAFIGEMAGGGGLGQGGGRLAAEGGLFGPVVADGEYWRLVTSGFLHSGLLHIGFNMWILWYAGTMLEPAIGRVNFLVLYFTSLLCGSFGALLLDPDALTVGASGAIFGLLGGAFVAMRARGIDPMQTGLGVTILLNLGITFLIPNISIGGHIGGLIGGALAALILIQFGDRQRSQLVPILGCAVLAAAAVAGSISVASGTGI